MLEPADQRGWYPFGLTAHLCFQDALYIDCFFSYLIHDVRNSMQKYTIIWKYVSFWRKKIRKMLCLHSKQTFPSFSLMQRNNLFTLFFFGAKKRDKRNIHPLPIWLRRHLSRLGKARIKSALLSLLHQFPLYGEDVIDSGQIPPSIKVLVWLTSLCPFGVSHSFSSAYANTFAHIKLVTLVILVLLVSASLMFNF